MQPTPPTNSPLAYGQQGPVFPTEFHSSIRDLFALSAPHLTVALQRAGESGDVQRWQALCVQNLHNFNEIHFATALACLSRGEGCLLMTVAISEGQGSIVVSSGERLDAKGRSMEVPMTISRSVVDQAGNITELRLIGNFMAVPLFELKVSRQSSGAWQLEVLDFASKGLADTLLPG